MVMASVIFAEFLHPLRHISHALVLRTRHYREHEG